MFVPNAVLAAAVVIFILFLVIRRNKHKNADYKRYPPSIPSLPLLGSIPFFTGSLETLHIFFMRKAEQLGPVIRFYAAGRMAVSLNGKEAIVDAMQKHADSFADKPDFWTEVNLLNSDSRGFGFAHYDDTFKHYHKLTLSILKEFGFGINQEMDIRISQEIEDFIREIRKLNGRPFDPKSAMLHAVSNVVMTILFGSESQAGIKRSKLIEDSNVFMENIDPIIDYAPFIRFLPTYGKKLTNMVGAHKRLMEQLEMAIEQNKRNPSERNFVTRFIEIEKTNYCQKDLVYILRDLCTASALTVQSNLLWTLLELANHPKVRIRLQRDIDEVCSGKRDPSIDDKPRLPYVEAVMCEVMRRHTVTFNTVPRLTMKATEICGCLLPRGCLAISNLYGVHMDPKTWGDPDNFRPERFLDKDNNVIKRNEIIPFGLGMRSCIGEVLARQEVLLFLVNLVQNFDIQPAEGQDFITAKDVQGLVVSPSPFKIRLIPRIKQQT